MNCLIHKLTLDMHKSISQASISVKKGDTNRKLHIILTEKGKVYQVDDGCTAVFSATKYNGDTLFNSCTIENGIIVYEFTELTANIPGKMDCEIKLYGADNSLITGPQFSIIVDGVVNKDSNVEASDEFSALTALISEAKEVVNKNTSLIVDIDEQGRASYTSTQIRTHVSKGGTVEARYEGAVYHLMNCESDYVCFVCVTDELERRMIEVDKEGNSTYSDDHLATDRFVNEAIDGLRDELKKHPSVTIVDDGKGNITITTNGTPIVPDTPDEPTDPDVHQHSYDNDQDATCNVCGAVREVDEPDVPTDDDLKASSEAVNGNHFLTLSATTLEYASEGVPLTVKRYDKNGEEIDPPEKVLCYGGTNLFPEKTFTWKYDSTLPTAQRAYTVELPMEYPAGQYRISGKFTNDSGTSKAGLIQACDKDGKSVGGSINLTDKSGERTGYTFTASAPIERFKFFTAGGDANSVDITATYYEMCMFYGHIAGDNAYKGDYTGVVYARKVDDEGNPILDENNNPIFEDADGNPLTFADGKTLMAEGGVSFTVSHEYAVSTATYSLRRTVAQAADLELNSLSVNERKYNSFPDKTARSDIKNEATERANEISRLEKLIDQKAEQTTDLPDYLIEEEDRVFDKVVNAGLEADLSFLVFADPHSFDGYKYRKYAKLMERGGIDFLLGLGDYNEYHNGKVPKNTVIGDMYKMLSDSGRGPNCFYAVGNHDAFTSNKGYGMTPDTMLTKKEQHKLFCSHLNGVAHFDEDDPYGCYYYVDYEASKIRVVVLNSSEVWDADGNIFTGTTQTATALLQRQMNWFTTTALDFTENPGWSVMVAIHNNNILPTVNNHGCHLYHILKALGSGGTYDNTQYINGSPNPQWNGYIDISADFRGKSADVIGIFYGHGHHDTVDTHDKYQGVVSMEFRCDNDHIDEVYIADVNGVAKDSYAIELAGFNANGTTGFYTYGFSIDSDYPDARYVQYNHYHVPNFVSQLTNNHYIEVWLLDDNKLPIKEWVTGQWSHGNYAEGMKEIATEWEPRRREGTASMESCAVVNINKTKNKITVVPYGLSDAREITYK